MPVRADTPCTGCGKLIWSGTGSLPADQRMCRPCRAERKAARAKPRRIPQGRTQLDRTCAWCARDFTTTDVRQRYCSKSCGAKKRLTRTSTPIPWVTCRCGRWIIARGGRKFCSPQCRNNQPDNAARIMALYRSALASIDVPQACMWRAKLTEYLAHRDGTRCGICGRTVDLTLPSGPRGDDRGPSIDHIQPRSRGGTDDLSNLRLTHWACNRQRGNRGGNEQLRLVG